MTGRPIGDAADGGDDDPDEPRVVVRDRRRVDPHTGQVRPGGSAGNPSTDEEVTVQDAQDAAQDAALGGVPASGTDVAGDDTGSGAGGPGLDTIEGVPQDGASSATVDDAEAAGSTSEATEGSATVPGEELERVQAELSERTADLQRVSAEYANYRRRVDRDRETTVAGAKAQVAGELMTVLDDVERAEAHGDLTGPFKVVAERLTETLQRVGLTPFGEVGDAFDPSMHEAVARESSAEVTEPTVSTVMRRGYRFGDRVLRAAMVAVTDHDPDAMPGETGADLPESEAAGNPGAINPDAT